MEGSVAFVLVSAVAGCSSSSNGAGDPTGPSGALDAGPTGAPDAATATTAGVPASCNGDEGGTVPTTPTELQAWLGKRLYTCWAHESVQHASTGPHGGEVKTFLSSKLEASMQSAGENAEGSVAVKELYAKGGTEVTGWAVSVKTQASSANGQGYYWYEAFGIAPGANKIEGQGVSLCVNCHSAGKDFVRIPYPLR